MKAKSLKPALARCSLRTVRVYKGEAALSTAGSGAGLDEHYRPTGHGAHAVTTLPNRKQYAEKRIIFLRPSLSPNGMSPRQPAKAPTDVAATRFDDVSASSMKLRSHWVDSTTLLDPTEYPFNRKPIEEKANK